MERLDSAEFLLCMIKAVNSGEPWMVKSKAWSRRETTAGHIGRGQLSLQHPKQGESGVETKDKTGRISNVKSRTGEKKTRSSFKLGLFDYGIFTVMSSLIHSGPQTKQTLENFLQHSGCYLCDWCHL